MRLAWLAAALVPSAALAQPGTVEPVPAPAPAPTPPPAPDPGADYAKPQPAGKDVVITIEGERSLHNKLTLGAIAGAGVLLGALGLYYNLDARSSANNVNKIADAHVPWTPGLQADYDNAHSSSIKAGVFYGLGGAVIIAAIVGGIITQPHSETTVIHPHGGGATATVVPTPGGAVLGGAWSF